MREDSQNSSAKTLSARYRNPSERPQIRDCLRNEDGNVFGWLGHRRERAFKRLSDTYSPSATKSRPDREYSKDNSYNRGCPHKRNSSPSRDRPQSRGCSHGIEESEGGHWKSKSKRCKPTNEEDLEVPWSCEERPRGSCVKFSSHSTGRTLGNAYMVSHVQLYPHRNRERIDGYTDLKAAFLAYLMKQKMYVKDPVEIHNIKQKDGETIEEFIERFKIETRRMKGALECMRIFEFMHRVNNPKLVKRLNKRIPNTLKEMMTATVAFIRGETATVSKKKVHTPWKSQEQSKWQKSKRISDFRN
nr:reverse transcriptase domain-containing protein [Tanacetum cinerariifolium]